MRQALLLFVRRYAGGDSIKHTVFDNVDRATVKVYSSQENVAGVKIPKFESVSEPGETKMELTGAFRCLHSSIHSANKQLVCSCLVYAATDSCCWCLWADPGSVDRIRQLCLCLLPSSAACAQQDVSSRSHLCASPEATGTRRTNSIQKKAYPCFHSPFSRLSPVPPACCPPCLPSCPCHRPG